MIYLFLSLISGLLSGLSFNSIFFSYLIWVSLIPFIYVISKLSRKALILNSIIFGLAFYGVAIFWLSKVTFLGLILLLFYLCVYPLVFALATKNLIKKPLAIITISCLWVVLEFIKEVMIFVGFGWTNLGYSQYRNLYFIQPVDLLGTKFISFLIVMVNIFFWEIVFRKKISFKKTIFVSFIFVSCFVYSFIRLNTLKESAIVKLSVIQPNIAQELKWKEEAAASIMETLKQLAVKADANSLVIFPEASWPGMLGYDDIDYLKNFSKDVNRDILMGAVTSKDGHFYNSALFYEIKGDYFLAYDKIKLVPFGEYIPLRQFLTFIDVINEIGDMSAGREVKFFPYRDKVFSVLICFEDVFPLSVSKVACKSDFLVNITNDAWFGGEPEASQHLSILTMRAIENRISVVRAANTGISGWVSFKGEINKLLQGDSSIYFAEQLSFSLPLNSQRSIYAKTGELFVVVCGIFLVLMLISSRKKLFIFSNEQK